MWSRKRCRRSSSGSLAFCQRTKTSCRLCLASYQTRVHCVLVADVRACTCNVRWALLHSSVYSYRLLARTRLCNVLVHCVVYRVVRVYTVVYQAVTYSNTGFVRLCSDTSARCRIDVTSHHDSATNVWHSSVWYKVFRITKYLCCIHYIMFNSLCHV